MQRLPPEMEVLVQGFEKILEGTKVDLNSWVNSLAYCLVESLVSQHDNFEDVKQDLIGITRTMANNAKRMFDERKEQDAASNTSRKG